MKGLLYSIILLTMLAPVLMLSLYYADAAASENSLLSNRVLARELSNFAESIETDFDRVLEASARGATVAAVNHVVSSGVPASDAEAALEELALYAGYEGEPSLLMAPTESNNNSLVAWTLRASDKGGYYGFNSSVTVNDFSVRQLDAFNLEYYASATLTVEFPAYGLFLQRSFSTNATVPLEGVEDPLYPLNSYGLVQRLFSFNSSGVYGIDAFNGAVVTGVYWPSALSPSFMARLEGSSQPLDKYSRPGEELGLASIVDLNEFIAQGIPYDEKPVVDYLFFNETAPSPFPVEDGCYEWVVLDASSAGVYGVVLE